MNAIEWTLNFLSFFLSLISNAQNNHWTTTWSGWQDPISRLGPKNMSRTGGPEVPFEITALLLKSFSEKFDQLVLISWRIKQLASSPTGESWSIKQLHCSNHCTISAQTSFRHCSNCSEKKSSSQKKEKIVVPQISEARPDSREVAGSLKRN